MDTLFSISKYICTHADIPAEQSSHVTSTFVHGQHAENDANHSMAYSTDDNDHHNDDASSTINNHDNDDDDGNSIDNDQLHPQNRPNG